MIKNRKSFPFTAIIGQEDFKTALILNIIDPTIGGVLAIGDKGTGKTTLIRSLAHLMNGEGSFPFVNMPIGASEDRVLGHLNLEKLINDKKEELQTGLLAKAHQGVLYVDEINLLNDYLMDVLLDASASGSYQLEREGISRKLDSQFCLIGSMNPEEGDLRPQLKDRFGLSVHIGTTNNVEERVSIVSNRLNFDDNPEEFNTQYKSTQEDLYQKIVTAKNRLTEITYAPDKLMLCSKIAIAHQVEGLRADILLLKTARAYTAFLGLDEITEEHIQTITPFVLNHRSNHQPSESPNQDEDQENDQHKEQEHQEHENDSQGGNNNIFQSIIPSNTLINKKADNASKERGKINISQSTNNPQFNQQGIKTVDNRKTVGQYLATNQFELKNKQQQAKTTKHIIFLLDSSGSMLQESVAAYAKGLIEKTIEENQGTKLSFSLISLYDGDAQLIAQATQKVDELMQQLQEIPTGGKTNVVPAFKIIKTLVSQHNQANSHLVIITDGKFEEAGINDFGNVITAYQTYCKGINELTIVDAEKGIVKLGLAKMFATKVNGNYQQLIIT